MVVSADRIQAWLAQSHACFAQGDLDGAREAADRLLAIAPDHGEALLLKAATLLTPEQGAEAEPLLRRVLTLQPHNAAAWDNLGGALRFQHRFTEAVCAHEAALALAPDHPLFWQHSGQALLLLGRLEEAAQALDHSLSLAPEQPDVWYDYCRVRTAQGRLEEALAWGRRAVAVLAEDARVHFHLATLAFLLQRWDEAWDHYAWRVHKVPTDVARLAHLPLPRWQGEETLPEGGRLLVVAEQGIGDEIMFQLPVAHLAARGLPIALELSPRLLAMAARSLPGSVTLFPRRDDTVALERLIAAGQVTAYVPMAELARFLWPDLCPPQRQTVGYLRPDPARCEALRARYQAPPYRQPQATGTEPGTGKRTETETETGTGTGTETGTGTRELLVGIAWFSTNPVTGALRSVPLRRLLQALDLPGVRLLSLQYGTHDVALAEARAETGRTVWVDTAVDPLTDIESFAAQVTALDLVVSVDNSTVHLAGALGVPCWVLLPAGPDWRWGQEGETCPWYPSLRLFRQEQAGAWAEPLARLRQALLAWPAGPAHRSAPHRSAQGDADASGGPPEPIPPAPIPPISVLPPEPAEAAEATAAEEARETGETGEAAGRASPPAAVASAPRVLLLNDSNAWGDWGEAAASEALRGGLQQRGCAVASASVRDIRALAAALPTPGAFEPATLRRRLPLLAPDLAAKLDWAEQVLVQATGLGLGEEAIGFRPVLAAAGDPLAAFPVTRTLLALAHGAAIQGGRLVRLVDMGWGGPTDSRFLLQSGVAAWLTHILRPLAPSIASDKDSLALWKTLALPVEQGFDPVVLRLRRAANGKADGEAIRKANETAKGEAAPQAAPPASSQASSPVPEASSPAGLHPTPVLIHSGIAETAVPAVLTLVSVLQGAGYASVILSGGAGRTAPERPHPALPRLQAAGLPVARPDSVAHWAAMLGRASLIIAESPRLAAGAAMGGIPFLGLAPAEEGEARLLRARMAMLDQGQPFDSAALPDGPEENPLLPAAQALLAPPAASGKARQGLAAILCRRAERNLSDSMSRLC